MKEAVETAFLTSKSNMLRSLFDFEVKLHEQSPDGARTKRITRVFNPDLVLVAIV